MTVSMTRVVIHVFTGSPSVCAHDCINDQGSYTCTCRSGYQLATDKVSCTDVNECSFENGGCAHNCTNLQGGFRYGRCNIYLKKNVDLGDTKPVFLLEYL